MKTSKEGVDLIKEHEGLRLEAYLPTPNDVWTIGWGTTRINGRPVHEGESITRHQAHQFFVKDLEKFERAILRNVEVQLSQNQFDALVSFVYNLGEGNLKRSTLLKKLNARDYHGAKEEFKKWVYQGSNKLPGLVKRRASEAELFGQGLPKKRPKSKPKPKPDLMKEFEELEEITLCQTEKSESESSDS